MESNERLNDEGMEAANVAVCEGIAKAAGTIAAGNNLLRIRSALAAAHVVFQQNRGKITQFQIEAHLESLQQLIAITCLLPNRPAAQEGL